jgi:hypothetical protein
LCQNGENGNYTIAFADGKELKSKACTKEFEK